jgi:hypothetical protein
VIFGTSKKPLSPLKCLSKLGAFEPGGAVDGYEYRGYWIEARREWSNWCANWRVSVYPLQPDLPILLARSTLQTVTRQKDDALNEAKHQIDRILAGCIG